MKNKFRSLLGIEMALGQREFKPFILLIGVLLVVALALPLMLVYSYLYLKSTLLNSWKEIKKYNKCNKYNGIRRV
jgi:uncharacterized membrane protein